MSLSLPSSALTFAKPHNPCLLVFVVSKACIYFDIINTPLTSLPTQLIPTTQPRRTPASHITTSPHHTLPPPTITPSSCQDQQTKKGVKSVKTRNKKRRKPHQTQTHTRNPLPPLSPPTTRNLRLKARCARLPRRTNHHDGWI